MKYPSAKMFASVITMLSLTVLGLMSTRTNAAAPTVFDDQYLMKVALATYDSGDYIYAALHMNALVQRNPQLLRDNPTLAKEVDDALRFSIDMLQTYKANSDAYTKSAANNQGIGVVRAGLSRHPPRINFPR